MNEIKKCKYCQTEINKKAKVCPVCKRNLKANGCLTFVIAFVVLCVIGIIVAQSTNDNIQKEVSGVSNKSEYITLEEFNSVKTDMTYKEVTAIIGSKGTVTSESSLNDYTIKIITWYGSGMAGSNANVTFTNGKVTSKAQFGLK